MDARYWYYNWRHEVSRRREQLVMAFVWRLPRSVAMWAFVRVATEGCKDNPVDQTVRDVLKRWESTY